MHLSTEQLNGTVYAVHSDDMVIGIGTTPQEAWADAISESHDSYRQAVHECGDGRQSHEEWAHENFNESVCTPEAAIYINNGGTAFAELQDGRIGTHQESAAA
ncbi:MAG: hypothetical protein H0X13_19905 [Ramlibacter sp.]|nr:hypothetical protein [Ramlibacter sp.]